jgi:ubiquitin-conjugating enzyme E2 D/E
MALSFPVLLISGKQVASVRLDTHEYGEQVRRLKKSIALQAKLDADTLLLMVGDHQLADTAKLNLYREELSDATHITLVQKHLSLAEMFLTPEAQLTLTRAQVPEEGIWECLRQKGWPSNFVSMVAADGVTIRPECSIAEEDFPLTIKLENQQNKRIKKEELELLDLACENSLSCVRLDESGWCYELSFRGPASTPYEDGVFLLDYRFSSKYPYSPPSVRFITKVYHCNVDAESGAISMDILADQWSPALTMTKVVLSIQSLLADPNPQDPLHADAAHLFLHNRTSHDEFACDWVRKHA